MRQLSPHTRRVHQVRLSAPSQDLVWRGRNLLEDALSTVSLPAAETSQLLFIRRFDAGTIHSQQSSNHLSVNLATKLQQISAIAISGIHPAAAQAPAVIFPDDLSAYAHFAYQLAIGHASGQSPSQSLHAWFWPCLLPYWQPTQSAQETAWQLLTHLATHEIAPLATATILRQLQKKQALTHFLTLLQRQEGAALLAQQGWHEPYSNRHAERKQSNRDLPQPTFLAALPPSWRAEDPRTLWLTAMSLVAQRPTLATVPDLIAIAQQHIQSSFTRDAQLHSPTSPESNISERSADTLLPTPSNIPSDLSSLNHLDPNTQTSNPTSQSPLSISPTDSETATTPDKDLSVNLISPNQHKKRAHQKRSQLSDNSQTLSKNPLPTEFSGQHTDYAGLIYLLNLLTYLHLPAYLPRYNNPDFPHLLLHNTALRLGVPKTDPILTVFADYIGTDYTQRENQSTLLVAQLVAWYSALRHWLRRHTPLTLKALIHRPGILALTPTHLDLTFNLTQVDIHIRRVGLDLNPGWLPWFGRVVQFHYQDTREAPSQRGNYS